MTSVDLITAETASPIFSCISSALRRVITLFNQVLADADYHVGHHPAELQFHNFTDQTVTLGKSHIP